MKKLLLLFLLAMEWAASASAQCTVSNVNWDNLDFLVSTGSYAGFVSDAFTRDQKFAFGRGKVRIRTASSITINGANGTNTGDLGSYGFGNDVQFTPTTTVASDVTLTFGPSAVSALKFSLFDIDASQTVTVLSYLNGVPVNTTLNKASASSGIVITGSPGIAPLATGPASNYASSDNRGTVNVDVPGSVDSVILRIALSNSSFWLSDLQACVPGAFPANYYAPSQPWPGQPSYILATSDTNRVHSIDPATGKAKEIFSESVSQYVNSLAYDQFSHNLFFTPDDVNPSVTQKALMKYDFNTESIVTITPDVANIGIPYFESGVESGGAAFYDSCLYIGIEGSNPGRTSSRKSIIWRVSFNAAGVPVEAVQAFAILVDDGAGTLLHDWADFTINNGVLYNWNSRVQSGSTYRVYQYDLNTQVLTTYTTATGFAPKQNGITWDGKIYDISGTTIRQYNGTTGIIGSGVTISGTNWVGSSGDGTEAFIPKADFGDAPAYYDPAASPAVHEMDTALRLGNTYDREWVKEGATIYADADGADEDGIGSVPILCPCSPNFVPSVKVYNNTGATATLIGWLDYNGNKVFDPGEAVTKSIPSSPTMQTVLLSWTTALTSKRNGDTTYLRLRLTSTANGMTSSNPSGYFANGEVEDYRVFVVGFFLDVKLNAFTAEKNAANAVDLNWKVSEQATLQHYTVQRTSDLRQWADLGMRPASGKEGTAQYSFTDVLPRTGTVYYRLAMTYIDGTVKYSEARQVSEDRKTGISLWPNPVQKSTTVRLTAANAATGTMIVSNAAGTAVIRRPVSLVKGDNVIELDASSLPAGIYRVSVQTTNSIAVQTLMKE